MTEPAATTGSAMPVENRIKIAIKHE